MKHPQTYWYLRIDKGNRPVTWNQPIRTAPADHTPCNPFPRLALNVLCWHPSGYLGAFRARVTHPPWVGAFTTAQCQEIGLTAHRQADPSLVQWERRQTWQLSPLTSSHMGFPGGSDGKEPACNAGDPGAMPGLGRSPGEGNGSLLQYSCLENPMVRRAWWAIGHDWATNPTSTGFIPHENGLPTNCRWNCWHKRDDCSASASTLDRRECSSECSGTAEENHPPWPGMVITTCMSCLTTRGSQ